MVKVMYKIMDKFIDGSDIYYHRNSLWIIFTNTKEWVIELTDKNTLWYNYRFFRQIFNFVSLDVVENQHYITKWVEDTIKNGVRRTHEWELVESPAVEDAIKNGIKYTLENIEVDSDEIEDTIKNGIKETYEDIYHHKERINGIIRNEVKNTYSDEIKGDYDWRDQFKPDEVINNGRKL
jgi:hypothetical protein